MCNEIRGVPQVGDLLEAGVAGGVAQDLAPSEVAGELLQHQGSPGDILGEGSGVVGGKEEELATRVEAALEDQGRAFRHPAGGRRACAPGAHASARFCHPWHEVEMRVEPQCLR
jgi:hypothetical protein